jgi:hypothetical protein
MTKKTVSSKTPSPTSESDPRAASKTAADSPAHPGKSPAHPPNPLVNPNTVLMQVAIRGKRPLWQHLFGPNALPLTPKEKSGVAGNDPEEWRNTSMINAAGQPYLLSSYLFAAIREGGRYLKQGRGNLLLPIAATLQVLDDPIVVQNRWWPGYETPDANRPPFDIRAAAPPPTDPTAPLYLDIRGVRNPTTRGRNVRYRVALSPGWELTFTIQFDKSIVSRDQMHSALLQSGDLVGIGNGRTIGMGRFTVLSFVEVTAEPEATSGTPA